jgi:hypothetical protein
MYAATATIRDYNHTTDTCSIELTGIGVIDTWLDGVHIATPLDRSLVVSGALATITFPDASRLCEGVVTSIAGAIQPATTTSGGTITRTQSVRAAIATDGVGHGSVAVLWPAPFSVSPTSINASLDYNIGSIAISAITPAGFTATLTGGPISSTESFTATAVGAA